MFSLNLKNSWSIFYLILFTNTVVLLTLTYIKYEDLRHKSYSEQGSLAKLLSHSFHSKLVENELLLDLLGKQLMENNRYQNNQSSHELLKKMLATNPALGGFGLANPQGDFISVSDNIDVSKLDNLLEKPITRESFQRTLQSNRLVPGRTYNFKAGNHWAIPIRKALRDESDKVVAVMTTGFRIDNGTFFNESDFAENRRVTFLNGRNHFRLYLSGLDSDEYQAIYSQPIPEEKINGISFSLHKNYALTLEQAQNTKPNTSFSIECYSPFFDKTVMGSAVYDPVYGVWTLVSEPKNDLYSDLLIDFSQYFLIFILSNLMIFGLIRSFSRYEASTRKKLLFQANHDPLTGLYNRNHLYHNFKTTADLKHPIKILFVDLDNFKNINDTFGHAVGDKLLMQVASRLQRFVSKSEQIIRFGGDEFVVLLFDEQPEESVAHDIIQTLSETYLIDKMRFNIGASIGIAYAQPQKHSLEIALSHADMAMYQAKKRKNSVEVFSDELQKQLQRKTAIEHHLRSAVSNGEIYLAYQPQLAANQEIYGVEALVRWHNPKLGQIPPNEFIPVAEEIGIMPKLGHFIAKTALNEVAQVQKSLNSRFNLSINVSVTQIMDVALSEELIQTILDSRLDPDQITIEVTESLFIESLDSVLPILKSFQTQGINLSLDDFGTGFSSLSLLRKLPINELKIDKMFVDDLLENSDDYGLIENIIDMARKMGISTVAEGIEHEHQVKILKEFGCELYQGYFYAQPLSKDKLEQFIFGELEKAS